MKATYTEYGNGWRVSFGDVVIGDVVKGEFCKEYGWISEDRKLIGGKCKTRKAAVQRLIDIHKERFHIPEDATP